MSLLIWILPLKRAMVSSWRASPHSSIVRLKITAGVEPYKSSISSLPNFLDGSFAVGRMLSWLVKPNNSMIALSPTSLTVRLSNGAMPLATWRYGSSGCELRKIPRTSFSCASCSFCSASLNSALLSAGLLVAVDAAGVAAASPEPNMSKREPWPFCLSLAALEAIFKSFSRLRSSLMRDFSKISKHPALTMDSKAPLLT